MSKKKEETAVTTQSENLQQRAVAMKEQAAVMASQMKELGVEAQDLVIPVLLLMQNTSELVGDGKAKLGDILNSQSEEIIGSIEKPVEIIPLKMFKTLRVYDLSSGKPKFKREDQVNAQNEKLPFEGNEEGKPIKRYLCLNFFVLLKSEIESDEAFPCVVRFKSTSMQAGKQLATQLFKMAMLGKLPYSKTVKLTATREKKDTNTYAVFATQPGGPASEKEKGEAEKWLSVLASVTHRVDSKEESVDDAPARTPTVVDAEVVGSASGPY